MSLVDDVKIVVRAATGRSLHGDEKTDATWSRPGTQTVNGHRRAGRWSYWSFRRRASTTLGSLGALVVVALAALVDLWSLVTTLRLVFWLGIVPFLVWVVVERARRYAHRREVVAPLAEALAERLGDARYALDPRSWLVIPVEVLDRPTRVYLPKTYSPTEPQEKALVRLIARKVGLVAPSSTFDLRGEAPFVELTPAPAPRDAVVFSDADVRALVENASEGRPVLGLGPRDVLVDVDLDAESPHVALSMATGAGKSVAARTLIAQVLRHGGIVLVLDRKIESQLWCVSHPGVRYACTEQEIYDALMAASGEIDRRFELVRSRRFAGQTIDREEIGPRLLVVCEELNALEIDLRMWWREIRDPQAGDPAQCPALPVLGRLLAMGRAARTHMLVIAQKLTCQAIGGPAARENLSTRVLGRATTSTWNMLAPECKVGGKYPRSSRHRGRVHVVVGDEATLTQVLFVGEDDALAYALGGTVTDFPVLGAGCARPTTSDVVVPGESATEAVVRQLYAVPEDDPLLTLSQALEDEVVGGSLDAVRRAAGRPGFPEAVREGARGAKLYRRSDLAQWWAEKHPEAVGSGAS